MSLAPCVVVAVSLGLAGAHIAGGPFDAARQPKVYPFVAVGLSVIIVLDIRHGHVAGYYSNFSINSGEIIKCRLTSRFRSNAEGRRVSGIIIIIISTYAFYIYNSVISVCISGGIILKVL